MPTLIQYPMSTNVIKNSVEDIMPKVKPTIVKKKQFAEDSTPRGGTKNTPWLSHVRAVQSKNKGMSWKEAVRKASSTYTPKAKTGRKTKETGIHGWRKAPGAPHSGARFFY